MSHIYLNDILNLSSDELFNSKIELNMTAGKGGEQHIERWLNHSFEQKSSGITSCSFWGWFQNKRNFYPGQYVFSFCKLSCSDWLLISVAEIIDVPKDSRAEIRIIEKYKSLFGRLIIQYYKGNTYSRYVFKMSNLIDKIIVKEILPCIYDGQGFSGYDCVNLPFRLLQNIFEGKIMSTYYSALQKITGVYCLTDNKTGRLYIGSATGDGGVAQRWGNYLSTSHGGNKKLIKLFNEQGEEYFKDNFSFTLLEYFGLSYDTEKILAREQYWKRCLQTIKHGYNDN